MLQLKKLPASIVALLGSASLLLQWYWTRPLWFDEEMIALNLRDRSFADLAGPLWLHQAAPLGWLWAQRAALLVFGPGERTLRALPVLFGIATIWLAWWTGRRWLRPLGATAFTLLCAFGVHVSFFPLEAKHYSADTFSGLLLVSLALWAVEPILATDRVLWPRVVVWWAAAAVAQWFAHGALFVAPACGLAILVTIWRHAGLRPALRSTVLGFVLVASFALHYWLSLRHTLGSAYLQQYWWHAFPPREGGLTQTLGWIGTRFPDLASNPGGTPLWILFWGAAVAGSILAIRRNRPLGIIIAGVPISAFVFGVARLVPLEERLSLWMLPAVYLAIAVAADSIRPRVLSAAIALSAIVVAANIVWKGVEAVRLRPESNHALDDRSGVRLLMGQRQPGDVLVGTHETMPAIWWYGGIKVSPPNLGRTAGEEAAPLLEVHRGRPGPDCQDPNLMTALEGRNRVAIYLGFASHIPPGFQELALDTLSRRGKLVAYKRIAEEGFAAVFDFRLPPAPWTSLVFPAPPHVPRPDGCVGFFPTERW